MNITFPEFALIMDSLKVRLNLDSFEGKDELKYKEDIISLIRKLEQGWKPSPVAIPSGWLHEKLYESFPFPFTSFITRIWWRYSTEKTATLRKLSPMLIEIEQAIYK